MLVLSVLFLNSGDIILARFLTLFLFLLDKPLQLYDAALKILRMDILLDHTIPTVDATSSQFDITRDELSGDVIYVATEYHEVAKAYSSDDELCISDHPSEDTSDLAQAVRDDFFPPLPQMVGRTYSSSGESMGMDEVDDINHMIHEISGCGNAIHGVGNWNVNGGSDEPNDEVEDDGYASVEDNVEDNGDTEATRKFEVTDHVPSCRAQELFVMAWNGESMSCGEDVGDLETLPSDAETICMEDDDRISGGEGGSVHTLNSSEETGEGEAAIAQQISRKAHIETVITSGRCITSHVIHSKDIGESYSSSKTSLWAACEDDVMLRRGVTRACEIDESDETDIGTRIHFEQYSDTKTSAGKKRKVLKHLRNLLVRCFGRK